MALPLPVLTFYRMPDVSPTGTTIADMLTAIYTVLTSSVDYRGTSLPSTHLWTWATGSTSGSISTIYNTAIPSGSAMTQNPTILIAGFSGSATPTMLADSYISSSILLGLNKNGGVYNNWTATLPMTTGSFTGFVRFGESSRNTTSTIIRTYISEEMLFFNMYISPTVQYWAFVGTLIEPYTSYSSSLSGLARSAELDDRLYGVASINTPLYSAFNSANTSIFFNRSWVFLPTTSTIITVSRGDFGSNAYDFSYTFIFERYKYLRWAGGAVSGNAAVGMLRGIYYSVFSIPNMLVFRNGTTDLFHLLQYNNILGFDAIALKAAP